MDSRHDHGEEAGPQSEQGDHKSSASSMQHVRALVSIHPVLKALAQLMAREAAAECMAATSAGSPITEETCNDQDHQTRKA